MNEEVLKQKPNDFSADSQKLESIGENDTDMLSRSEPNIQSELNDDIGVLNDSINAMSLSDDTLAEKRAISEPSIPVHQSMSN